MVATLPSFAAHTESQLVNRELWQHWQDYVTAMSFGAAGAGARSSPNRAQPFAAFAQAAEQFSETARSVFGAENQTQTTATFIDAIRELYSNTAMPWHFELGDSDPRPASPLDMSNHPALGLAREHQQRTQRMAQAWQQIEEAKRRLERLWSDALREAATAYATRLGSAPPTGLDAQAMHGLYDRWIDCAEDAYSRMAHSESFCDALAEFVNASSHWRRELQELIEHAAKVLDLPTRSELNSLTQRLREVEDALRRERSATNPKAPPAKRPSRARSKPP